MIEAEALKHIPGLSHGFFTRRGGHSHGAFSSLNCGFGSGDDRETVARNRAIVADALSIAPDRLLTVYQEHSPKSRQRHRGMAAVISSPRRCDGDE